MIARRKDLTALQKKVRHILESLPGSDKARRDAAGDEGNAMEGEAGCTYISQLRRGYGRSVPGGISKESVWIAVLGTVRLLLP